MVARRTLKMPLKTLMLSVMAMCGVAAQAEAAKAEPTEVTALRAHLSDNVRHGDDAGDVVFRSDRVYVLDASNLRIQIHQASSRYLVTIPLNTVCSEPTNLMVDERNYLWVLDASGYVVQLDDKGQLVLKYELN